mgnify:CR=1 FL=1
MIINQSKIKIGAAEIIVLILSVLYVIGIRSWFSVCPVMSGIAMPCHWAGEMLKAISILILVLSILHMMIPDEKIKIGMDVSLIGISMLCMFVPGTIIQICGGEQMACRNAAHPWTLAFCGALIAVLLADLIAYASALSKERHSRKDNK